MINLFLLIALLVAVHYFWIAWYIPYEAKRDHNAITKDGSRDSLKGNFHALGFLRRLTVGAALSALFFYFHWLLPFAVLVTLGAWFFTRFNLLLNRLRGLPEDYVGKTAFIDRLFGKYPDKMKNVKGFLLLVGYCFIGVCLLDYLDTNGILRIFG